MTADLDAKESPFELEATNEAIVLLASMWPTVRAVAPTAQDVSAGLWEATRARASDSPDPPGMSVGRRASSGGDAGATWSQINDLIGYEWWDWDFHPRQRVRTLVHEALHAIGFVHPKGQLPAYREIVQRVMRLPEIRAIRLTYERRLRKPCGREGCAHPRMAHTHYFAGHDETGDLLTKCLSCPCSEFASNGQRESKV